MGKELARVHQTGPHNITDLQGGSEPTECLVRGAQALPGGRVCWLIPQHGLQGGRGLARLSSPELTEATPPPP